MKDGDRYFKFVEWSDIDQCYIGSCPELCGPCCHGDDEGSVYKELCEIVEEVIELKKKYDEKLPEPKFRNQFLSQHEYVWEYFGDLFRNDPATIKSTSTARGVKYPLPRRKTISKKGFPS